MAGDPALAVSSVGPFGPMTIAPSTVLSCKAARAAASSPTTETSKASAPPACATPGLDLLDRRRRTGDGESDAVRAGVDRDAHEEREDQREPGGEREHKRHRLAGLRVVVDGDPAGCGACGPRTSIPGWSRSACRSYSTLT